MAAVVAPSFLSRPPYFASWPSSSVGNPRGLRDAIAATRRDALDATRLTRSESTVPLRTDTELRIKPQSLLPDRLLLAGWSFGRLFSSFPTSVYHRDRSRSSFLAASQWTGVFLVSISFHAGHVRGPKVFFQSTIDMDVSARGRWRSSAQSSLRGTRMGGFSSSFFGAGRTKNLFHLRRTSPSSIFTREGETGQGRTGRGEEGWPGVGRGEVGKGGRGGSRARRR